MDREECEQILVRGLSGIKGDAHDFRVAGVPAAYFVVGGVRSLAAHVTGLDRLHALQLVVHGFQAPETTAGKSRNFVVHCPSKD